MASWENGKVTASTGEEFEEADAHPFDPSHEINHPNLADMDDMHEAPLVHLLQRRFAADEIYTFTGDILISVNPYKPTHGLYRLPAGPEAVRDPAHAPHLYVVADRAHQSLAKAVGADGLEALVEHFTSEGEVLSAAKLQWAIACGWTRKADNWANFVDEGRMKAALALIDDNELATQEAQQLVSLPLAMVQHGIR